MKKTMKCFGASILAATMLLSVGGCGTQSSTDTVTTETTSADAAASNEGKTIKVVLKTLSSEYWQYVAKGCEQAEKDFGVTVDILGATSETAYDEQMQMIETVLSSSGADAMVVAPLQSGTVSTQIADATIPIIAIDTEVPSDKVLGFVGFNNEEMSEMGAEAAAKAAKAAGWEEITAISIAGVQGDATSEARIKGYAKGIENCGGTFLFDETQYADSVADRAVTCMEAIAQTHPEGVAVIVTNNDDMAIAAKRTVEDFPAFDNTIFMGCGGAITGMDAIMAGEETMTVAVDGWDVGYLGVKAAVDALNGETIEKFIASPATIVDASNAEEHKQEVLTKLNG